MSRDHLIDGMLAWLNGKLAPPGVAIARDTPLFASGLIDSIRVLQLIAWTEQALGRQIPDVMIRMDNFQTVARIAEVFVAEETHAVG